jgi:hypothetical protein
MGKSSIVVRRSGLYLASVPLLLSQWGCANKAPEATQPGGGMSIFTYYQAELDGPIQTVAGAQIELSYVSDKQYQQYYAAGSDYSPVNAFTGPNGQYYNANKRSPALWTFTWGANGAHPECLAAFGNNVNILIFPIDAYNVGSNGELCEAFNLPLLEASGDTPVTFSPNSINVNAKPPSVSVNGSGFTTTYGVPVVQFYDSGGNFITEQGATSTTATQIIIPTPSLGVESGTKSLYLGVVVIPDASGAY